jgi:N-acetylmuramoyl-L-alanine amidase
MPIRYEVKAGDCISSIGFEHGFLPDTIWNYPDNEELKKLRQDPNVLLPGDIIIIPNLRLKEVSEPTNMVHKFYRKAVPEKLRLQFKLNDLPRANEPYTVEIDQKIVMTDKKTDSEGRIECSIPPNAREILVIFNNGQEVYKVYAGLLNPIDEISGVQARLKNLGFYAGPIDNKLSPEFEEAIRSYQTANNLGTQDGILNDETRTSLKQAYGG